MKKLIIPIFLLIPFIMQSQDIQEFLSQVINNDLEVPPDAEVWLMDSMYIYTFEQSNQDSLLTGKELMSYTDHGQILVDSSLARIPDSSQWLYIGKREYAYDIYNRLHQRMEYMGDFINNIWIKKWLYEHSYVGSSSQKQYTLTRHFNQGSQTWEKKDSLLYTYNAQQQLEFDYLYHWNSDSGKYLINEYRHYAYNAQGWCTSDTLYYYYGPGPPITTFLRKYEYDGNGNETKYRSYDGWSGSWIEVEKHEYAYNASDNRISDHRYEWDQSVPGWDLIELGLFSYDEDGILFLWRYFEMNDTTGLWDRDFSAQLFWSLHTIVDIAETEESMQLHIWPNPTKGLVSIESPGPDHLQVFSMEGKLCHSQKLTKGTNTVNLGKQPPGLYIIRSSGSSALQKLLIR